MNSARVTVSFIIVNFFSRHRYKKDLYKIKKMGIYTHRCRAKLNQLLITQCKNFIYLCVYSFDAFENIKVTFFTCSIGLLKKKCTCDSWRNYVNILIVSCLGNTSSMHTGLYSVPVCNLSITCTCLQVCFWNHAESKSAFDMLTHYWYLCTQSRTWIRLSIFGFPTCANRIHACHTRTMY